MPEGIELIFGQDGLRPGIVKMFYDPWHQNEPGGPFDHERTTKWMRYFVREGLKKTRDRGDDLTVFTTLYGPPPWACIQRPAKWVGGDPNPGCAIRVYEDGKWEVMRGYYYYKQICRAGQSGMGVARTMAMDSEVAVVGFSRYGTKHPDAVMVVNTCRNDKKIGLKVKGGGSKAFESFRTSDEKDSYRALGDLSLDPNDILIFDAPARSATTFFAK